MKHDVEIGSPENQNNELNGAKTRGNSYEDLSSCTSTALNSISIYNDDITIQLRNKPVIGGWPSF